MPRVMFYLAAKNHVQLMCLQLTPAAGQPCQISSTLSQFDIKFTGTCMTCNTEPRWSRLLHVFHTIGYFCFLGAKKKSVNVTQKCPAWTTALPVTSGCVDMTYVQAGSQC